MWTLFNEPWDHEREGRRSKGTIRERSGGGRGQQQKGREEEEEMDMVSIDQRRGKLEKEERRNVGKER